MDQSKIAWSQKIEQAATLMAQARSILQDASQVYTARGYGDEKTGLKQEDLTTDGTVTGPSNVRASVIDLVAMINFSADFEKYLSGQTVTPNWWGNVIEKIRTDF